jgi:N-carbamoyl-L-amino-acid hydrolase
VPQINRERLINDLKTLRKFGSIANGTSVVRQSFSVVDLESRQWLIERLREAGLEAALDGVGNVIGRSRNPGKALLIGSHTDTQPTGGWLDGAMGVIYGLEVARTLAEDPQTRDLPLDVASWMDEEGTFVGMLRSCSFCDVLPVGMVEGAVSGSGVKLTDAMRAAGVTDLPAARYDRERYAGYLEAHIE